MFTLHPFASREKNPSIFLHFKKSPTSQHQEKELIGSGDASDGKTFERVGKRLKRNHPNGHWRTVVKIKAVKIQKDMGATIHSIEVNAPISEVYNQWTQFEEFPNFMEGVEEVRQESPKSLPGFS
jgi:hypothetical protein